MCIFQITQGATISISRLKSSTLPSIEILVTTPVFRDSPSTTVKCSLFLNVGGALFHDRRTRGVRFGVRWLPLNKHSIAGAETHSDLLQGMY